MFSTLYARLAVFLLALFLLIGGVLATMTLISARVYYQESTQELNLDLAQHIVAEKMLWRDGQINHEVLKDIFHMMMVINPTIELYLLGTDGEILAYSAPPGRVQQHYVSMAPVFRFLEGQSRLPILGDDPRHAKEQKIFSAASVMEEETLRGYLYIILTSEQMDSVVQLLEGSHILRISTWAIGAALLFGLVTGLIAFSLLTRRLRRLSSAMKAFRQSDFSEVLLVPFRPGAERDEIDQLGTTFAEMAERIQAQMAQLRENDALRRKLVANVSHDLRTPLASLQGYLETLLLKGEGLTTQSRREYLEIAARQAKRLSRLILELFELAKLDSGEIKPHLETFSLAELLYDVAQKFQLRAEEKGVQIETDLRNDTPFAEADIGMIERVLSNLIENALEHTPTGGSVRLSLAPGGHHVTVQVADTGYGIAQQDLPYIFARFYRGKPLRARRGEGAGLGLAIAQSIVELHGGKLFVESELNRGTAFRFDLPVHGVMAS